MTPRLPEAFLRGSRLTTAALLALAVLAGCGDPGGPGEAGAAAEPVADPAPPRGEAFALPDIDLSGWPERVRTAIGDARQRAAAEPDSAEALGELGLQLYGADFPLAAAACLARATELDPDSARWPYMLSIARERAGDPAAAIAALETADARRPDDVPTLVALGTLLAETDPARGASLLRRAIEIDADNARAWFGLGRCAQRDGRDKEALDHYRKAIELFPRYGEASYAAAMLLAADGRRDEAAPYLERHAAGEAPSLANDPWRSEMLRLRLNAAELRRRAGQLAAMGAVDQAAAMLEESIAIDESGATSHMEMGVLLARQGKLEEAAGHFRKALESDPENVEALSSLGLALADLGRGDEAESTWRRTLELHPDHAPTLVYLGRRLAATGRAAEGVGLLERGVEVQPANALYRYVLAEALLATGDAGRAGRAVVHLERAAELLPDSARIWNALAAAYGAAGRSDDAGRARQRAGALSGRAP